KYIPPMQAFFVIASSDGTFSISNANRSHTGDDNYYKSAKEVPNGLVLYTNNGAHQDELFIQFNNLSSNGFDLKYYAYKFLSNAEGISQLFSIQDDIEFSIDVRPEAEIIQLGFLNNQNGLYTIGLKENGYMEKLVLEDTKTSTFFDLSHGEYEFLWNITDSKKRFKLHFNATAIEESILPLARIYSFNKTLRISSDITLKDVQLSIYDMMGRQVYEKFFGTLDQETIELNSETGTYLVSVKSQNSIITEKIMIK
ncbi:MAG: T9SS type A sorting domain-containing protein, partial [Bacteroidales bacterium]|nr:T9SS type A sorting domain-containing protein [Bacteroidales bacterium]